jgi:hypothetical protein
MVQKDESHVNPKCADPFLRLQWGLSLKARLGEKAMERPLSKAASGQFGF